MLLVNELVEFRAGQVRALAGLPADCLFAGAGGRIDPAALIELAAQGAAALRGFEARLKNEPVRLGYLAGIRDFEISGEARAGEPLEIQAIQEFAMEQAALVRAEVRRSGQPIAAGTIKVWEEREWPAAPPCNPCSNPGVSEGLPAALEPAGAPHGNWDDPIGRALPGCLEGIESATASPATIAGWFRLPPDFPAFDGHFPGYPILPAVVMPRMAALLAQARLGRALELRAIPQAKITRGIFPGRSIRVEATLEPEAGPEIRIKTKITDGGLPLAVFSMIVKQ